MRTFTSIFMVLLCINSLVQKIEFQSISAGVRSPISIKNAGDSRLMVYFVELTNTAGVSATKTLIRT